MSSSLFSTIAPHRVAGLAGEVDDDGDGDDKADQHHDGPLAAVVDGLRLLVHQNLDVVRHLVQDPPQGGGVHEHRLELLHSLGNRKRIVKICNERGRTRELGRGHEYLRP